MTAGQGLDLPFVKTILVWTGLSLPQLEVILGIILIGALCATILVPLIKGINAMFDRSLLQVDPQKLPVDPTQPAITELHVRLDLLKEEKSKLETELSGCKTGYTEDVERYRIKLRDIKQKYHEMSQQYTSLNAKFEMLQEQQTGHLSEMAELKIEFREINEALVRCKTLLEVNGIDTE